MSPGQKVLVYFGIVKPPAVAPGTFAPAPSVGWPTLVSLVVSGVVFGLLTSLMGDDHPVLSGVMWFVVMGILAVVRDVRRRRKYTLGSPRA